MKKINPMKKILKQTQVSIIALLAVVALSSCVNKQGGKIYEDAIDIPVYQEMQAELTPPPHVPTPVGKRKAKKLIVDMEIVELEGTMTDGVTYLYWTFDGTEIGRASCRERVAIAV